MYLAVSRNSLCTAKRQIKKASNTGILKSLHFREKDARESV